MNAFVTFGIVGWTWHGIHVGLCEGINKNMMRAGKIMKNEASNTKA